MYMFRLVALSLLLCATPAAARDRATHALARRAATVPPDAARPSAALSGRYAGAGPSNARFPLVSNLDVGVGLYSVSGHFVRERERNGREPIQRHGRTRATGSPRSDSACASRRGTLSMLSRRCFRAGASPPR